jgi:hypothetical protein
MWGMLQLAMASETRLQFHTFRSSESRFLSLTDSVFEQERLSGKTSAPHRQFLALSIKCLAVTLGGRTVLHNLSPRYLLSTKR